MKHDQECDPLLYRAEQMRGVAHMMLEGARACEELVEVRAELADTRKKLHALEVSAIQNGWNLSGGILKVLLERPEIIARPGGEA